VTIEEGTESPKLRYRIGDRSKGDWTARHDGVLLGTVPLRKGLGEV